jgi:3',5'-cyclic AMP phosphodiesterase CpdA
MNINQKNKVQYRILTSTLFVLCFAIFVSLSYAEDSRTPERIILNLTTSPATSQAVTWRTGTDVNSAKAQITVAIASPKLAKHAVTIEAQSTELEIDKAETVLQHSATFTDLTPNTLYAYRVGDGKAWSEWNQFKTAHKEMQPFKFVNFGDPQNDIKSLCSRVFRTAFAKAPDAAFWHFVGDIVDDGDDDKLWGELFEAVGFIPRNTPFILLPGNHEYMERNVGGKRKNAITPLWRPQFTLPENGPAGLEEMTYYLDYQGVRLIMLNGNEMLDKQARWMDEVLSDNPNRWTIAAIHQPCYSSGQNRDNKDIRERFTSVFDKHNIDLVLQGHDHTYGRTYRLRGDKVITESKTGTVYVVSVCGSKIYNINEKFVKSMAKIGTGRQLFQVITIDSTQLKYESFTATGELYDAFELESVLK